MHKLKWNWMTLRVKKLCKVLVKFQYMFRIPKEHKKAWCHTDSERHIPDQKRITTIWADPFVIKWDNTWYSTKAEKLVNYFTSVPLACGGFLCQITCNTQIGQRAFKILVNIQILERKALECHLYVDIYWVNYGFISQFLPEPERWCLKGFKGSMCPALKN